MCKEYKIPFYSLLAGILITLITSLFPNVFLWGVSYWGYLLPWLKRAAYPGSPTDILWINFFVNIVIWSVLIYLAIVSIEEGKGKKKPIRKIKR
jgi:hypothetical protein